MHVSVFIHYSLLPKLLKTVPALAKVTDKIFTFFFIV